MAKYDDVIITRNPYGSLCLNTPDVLFADIDYLNTYTEFSVYPILSIVGFLIFGQYIFFPEVYTFSLVVGIIGILSIMGGKIFAYKKNNPKADKTPEALALKTIERFSESNPEWHLRIYKTPAGLRILVMHDIFNVESSIDIFEALDTDYNYINMCKLQDCFRARVSPKPWRIGPSFREDNKIYPQGADGLWPVKEEFMEERKVWIKEYDELAINFASCKFLKAIGGTMVHPKAEGQRRWPKLLRWPDVVSGLR